MEGKPRIRAGYAHLITTYVAPRIGRIRLQALRPADLSTLYRELLESGGRGGKPLSARSVEYVHAVLRKALADAVRNDQVLTVNPAERAKRPRKEQSVAVVMWTAEDLASFDGFRLRVAKKYAHPNPICGSVLEVVVEVGEGVVQEARRECEHVE